MRACRSFEPATPEEKRWHDGVAPIANAPSKRWMRSGLGSAGSDSKWPLRVNRDRVAAKASPASYAAEDGSSFRALAVTHRHGGLISYDGISRSPLFFGSCRGPGWVPHERERTQKIANCRRKKLRENKGVLLISRGEQNLKRRPLASHKASRAITRRAEALRTRISGGSRSCCTRSETRWTSASASTSSSETSALHRDPQAGRPLFDQVRIR
jgi:hypothetical protein